MKSSADIPKYVLFVKKSFIKISKIIRLSGTIAVTEKKETLNLLMRCSISLPNHVLLESLSIKLFNQNISQKSFVIKHPQRFASQMFLIILPFSPTFTSKTIVGNV